mmetsp:Transcript_10106/g.21446  ORF Transcript_10106/g.21446 Transcript_10106/m.21446 type:complete len:271 (-) Transcript_10106:178-990(-)
MSFRADEIAQCHSRLHALQTQVPQLRHFHFVPSAQISGHPFRQLLPPPLPAFDDGHQFLHARAFLSHGPPHSRNARHVQQRIQRRILRRIGRPRRNIAFAVVVASVDIPMCLGVGVGVGVGFLLRSMIPIDATFLLFFLAPSSSPPACPPLHPNHPQQRRNHSRIPHRLRRNGISSRDPLMSGIPIVAMVRRRQRPRPRQILKGAETPSRRFGKGTIVEEEGSGTGVEFAICGKGGSEEGKEFARRVGRAVFGGEGNGAEGGELFVGQGG